MRLSAGLTTVAVLLLASTPLRAQTAAPNDSARVAPDTATAAVVTPRTSPAPIGGAALTGLRAGVHLAETPRAAQPNAAATNPHLGQARALMIVGGAALITGAIIGGSPGTIIMVGGAVVGLYGLYQYLQ